ncbi:MAG: SGNH/GDSL hydrolase family protein [Myxococcales bacterium]|nr:SGNH/GDSL hydrolase family protein [Myxococcales bacterium]
MGRKLLINVALVVITVAVCLGVVEVGLRGYLKMQRRYGPEHARDKALGWVKTKSEDAFDRPGEYYGKHDTFALMRYSTYVGYFPSAHHTGDGYQTNNLGFRNTEDIALVKPADEVRVVVLGGSTAWGAGVLQEDTYAAMLQSLLQAQLPGKAVRVWNAGVGAYLSTHERALVVDKVAALRPDAVVHLTGWNDTYSGYRGFDITDDRWDYTSSAAVLGQFHKMFTYDADSALGVDPGPPTRAQHDLALFYLLDQPYYAKQLDAKQKPHDQVVEGLLYNMKIARTAADEVPVYLVALQPTLYATKKALSPFEVEMKAHNQAQTPAFGDYNAAVYARYRALLPERLAALRIDMVDMDEAISAEARSVFIDHVHFGDRGNRMMAERLLQALLPKLSPSSVPPPPE